MLSGHSFSICLSTAKCTHSRTNQKSYGKSIKIIIQTKKTAKAP